MKKNIIAKITTFFERSLFHPLVSSHPPKLVLLVEPKMIQRYLTGNS